MRLHPRRALPLRSSGVPLSLDEAVRTLRRDPSRSQLVMDAYLDEDVKVAADRFLASGEYVEVLRTLNGVADKTVLDLGAGRGIAARAFLHSFAGLVIAVEPDPSPEVGSGAIRHLCADAPIRIVGAVGEQLPIKDESIDVVYMRQVLHHVTDILAVLQECARVLRRGGVVLATREHVVDGPEQLRRFLGSHPVHQLAGGENAFSLPVYLEAVTESSLHLRRLWGPWDSVINASPAVSTETARLAYPQTLLRRKLGVFGAALGRANWVQAAIFRYLGRPTPGRMYSFLLEKR